jgi:tellurite resistance protein
MSDEEIIVKELLNYLTSPDLSKKDKKAIKRVLAHYMTSFDYDKEFGAGEWERLWEIY